MSSEFRTLRWTCPHCKGEPMKLHSAHKHLRLKHAECWSCDMERMLLLAMMRGEGWLVEAWWPTPADPRQVSS